MEEYTIAVVEGYFRHSHFKLGIYRNGALYPFAQGLYNSHIQPCESWNLYPELCNFFFMKMSVIYITSNDNFTSIKKYRPGRQV